MFLLTFKFENFGADDSPCFYSWRAVEASNTQTELKTGFCSVTPASCRVKFLSSGNYPKRRRERVVCKEEEEEDSVRLIWDYLFLHS